MIRKQCILDLSQELIVDNFAGGGGASTGIEMALRRHVDIAINHDPLALGMHARNHPQTLHLPEDVFAIDPLKVTKGRAVGLAWFSPDCKHHSKAKGGKPLDKKIRGLALVMINWADAVRPRVIMMENVEEIQSWGPLLPNNHPDPAHKGRTWRALVAILGPGIAPDHPDLPEIMTVLGGKIPMERLCRGFGYDIQGRELRGYSYGAPTIRKRFFMVARCDGAPIVWPAVTHVPPEEARGTKLKPWRTSAGLIDWSLPCPSIFLTRAEVKERKLRCQRPLAPATMARIAKGIGRYVLDAKQPFIVSLTHQGDDRIYSTDEPLRTVTGAKRGEKALVAPVLAVNTTGHASTDALEPLSTVATGGHHALVAPVLARTAHGDIDRKGKKRGRGAHEVTEPLPSTLASRDLAVVAPILAYAQHGGGVRPADEPLHTIAASPKDQNQVIAVHLTKFHQGNAGTPLTQPCPTVTANSYVKRPGGAVPLGLVAANMVKLRGTDVGSEADSPLHVISAGGRHHGVVAAYLAQHNGGANGHQAVGHEPTVPVSTISSKGSQQAVVGAALMKYYGTDQDPRLDEPLHSATTHHRFGLATVEGGVPPLSPDLIKGARRVARFLRSFGIKFEGEFATVGEYVIVDIGMRMLVARELFRAQGFPDSYVIDRALVVEQNGKLRMGRDGRLQEIVLTGEAQIRMCGNSVCPDVACALVAVNVPELKYEEAAA